MKIDEHKIFKIHYSSIKLIILKQSNTLSLPLLILDLSYKSTGYNLNNFKYKEVATRGVPCKKVFLEISQNSQENIYARVSFLIKLQALGFQLY